MKSNISIGLKEQTIGLRKRLMGLVAILISSFFTLFGMLVLVLIHFYVGDTRGPWSELGRDMAVALIVAGTVGLVYEILVRRDMYILVRDATRQVNAVVDTAGIVAVYPDQNYLGKLLNEPPRGSKRFRFLVRAGARYFGNVEFMNWLESHRGAEVRILLQVPSVEYCQRRAKENPAVSAQVIHSDIVNSYSRLSRMIGDGKPNVAVRFYDHYPRLRLVFINDDLYVSHYPESKHSVTSPVYKMRKGANSMFMLFDSHFEEIWAHALRGDDPKVSPLLKLHGRGEAESMI